MDRLERLRRMRRLVEVAGGRVDGRKKLHKLAYLCQRQGTDLGQWFQFYMYGVFSPSLAQDLDATTSWDVLEEDQRGDQFVISLGKEAMTDVDGAERSEEPGFSIVAKLAKESPQMLKVLTTLVYLWDKGYRGEQLEGKLEELKGHLRSCFARARELARQYLGVDASAGSAVAAAGT